ncbi:uncharacterized protein DUF2490 [Algoriphagus aquaeductus]|uniref:Uncharacterized protein DUF2490 n=1 Tax=Algoriphagus aquaeductus TaxID=475299 RepID=A0A326S1B3_9BACT|nr:MULTISPECIES: DUF2490 domain-containing protein [Algoriphagus]PZV87367.1 uncharacterized protein DUF2490 [Algoriphagus aquaeductus]
MKKILLLLFSILCAIPTFAQDPNDLGAWYMYFGNFRFKESPWAIHGEAQLRSFQVSSDLDQLLLRTGLQYNLKSGQASFLTGYASITSGTSGKSRETFHENRIFQEAILRQKLGKIGLTHRYRYEQRWIEDQDFRTRFRYTLFLNIPLNSKELSEQGSWYLQAYDEIFINGEKPNERIEYFDRNRLYLGLGYRLQKGVAMQLGFLEQTTNTISKGQLQVGIFHQLYSRK